MVQIIEEFQGYLHNKCCKKLLHKKSPAQVDLNNDGSSNSDVIVLFAETSFHLKIKPSTAFTYKLLVQLVDIFCSTGF